MAMTPHGPLVSQLVRFVKSGLRRPANAAKLRALRRSATARQHSLRLLSTDQVPWNSGLLLPGGRFISNMFSVLTSR